MIQASDLKRGNYLTLDNAPYVVMEVSAQSPSARGASTLIKARIRNLKTGQVFDKTWRSSDSLDEAQLDRRKAQFLYAQDDELHFMELETYDQFALTREFLGQQAGFVTENLEVQAMYYNDVVLSVQLPNTVELEVVETVPALKGATAQAQTKPATLNTGVVVQVPAYVETGERILVDTRDGHFVGRAN